MKKHLDNIVLALSLITGVQATIGWINDINIYKIIMLTIITVLLLVISIILNKKEKKDYPEEIDGMHISALDNMDPYFILNKHIELLEAKIIVRIQKKDIYYEYNYIGKKLIDTVKGIYFNSSSESNNKHDDYCNAYEKDLDCDTYHLPMNKKKVGTPGLAYRDYFEFNNNDTVFDIKIDGKMAGPLPEIGRGYYFVRLSFKNSSHKRIKFHFEIHFDRPPVWVKNNIIDGNKDLIKSDNMSNCNGDENIFFFEEEKKNCSHINIFTFERR